MNPIKPFKMCSCVACIYVCSHKLYRDVLIVMPGNKVLEISGRIRTTVSTTTIRLSHLARSSHLEITKILEAKKIYTRMINYGKRHTSWTKLYNFH